MTRLIVYLLTALWLCCLFWAVQALAQPEYCKTLPADCGAVPKECLPALPSLVYTRQPRIEERYANWQRWYDAGQPDRFTEADLVLDDRKGGISVIHDCTTTKPVCAAHDGRVSPDGLRIAYTLAEGDALYPVKTWGAPADQLLTPPIEFKATKYSIWIYDIASKTAQLVEPDARMPDWYSDTSLVFASGRAGTYNPWAVGGMVPGYEGKRTQIYKADLSAGKLTNITNLTPHVFAMSPAVLSTGDIVYSSWQGFGDRGIGHTPANMWWVELMHGDGAGQRVILGAHGSPDLNVKAHLVGIADPYRMGENDAFRVLRPMVEIKRGKLAVDNYYRSNHQGAMGMIYGMDMPGEAEGCSQEAHIAEATYKNTYPGSGRYVPCDLHSLTPYGADFDNTVRFDLKGRAMGKAGYAAAAGFEGEFLFTHCEGSCYEGTLPAQATTAWAGGPTSHRMIALALVPVVTDPRDPKQVKILACGDPAYNCFDGRIVAPHQALFGQAAPSAN